MTTMNIFRWIAISALCMICSSIVSAQDIDSRARQIASAPAATSGVQSKYTQKLAYYNDGKVMSCTVSTPEGTPVEKRWYFDDGKVKKTERYDRLGEKIEEINYDDEGKLDDGIDGWAAKRWTYMDRQLRVESFYGEDGHITERKIYNSLGDMVDRQYIGDGKIDPTEEFNRGSIVNHETDEFFDKYGHKQGSVTAEVNDIDDLYWGW